MIRGSQAPGRHFFGVPGVCPRIGVREEVPDLGHRIGQIPGIWVWEPRRWIWGPEAGSGIWWQDLGVLAEVGGQWEMCTRHVAWRLIYVRRKQLYMVAYVYALRV